MEVQVSWALSPSARRCGRAKSNAGATFGVRGFSLVVERRRHLAKAVTYRVFGSAATAGIAFVVSGSVQIGAVVGVADSVSKIILYYVHERIWYRIRWGVKPGAKHPD